MDPYLDSLDSVIKPYVVSDRILTWHLPFYPRCAISTVEKVIYGFKTGSISDNPCVTMLPIDIHTFGVFSLHMN